MLDGIAYILNLKRILRENNMQPPEGIILSDSMFQSIVDSHVAMLQYPDSEPGNDCLQYNGFKIYRGEK